MKHVKDNLSYFQCLKLLEYLVEIEMVKKNPDIPSDIFVYCEGNGKEHPEGWYSENIYNAARDLAERPDEQRMLLETITEKGFAQPELPELKSVMQDAYAIFGRSD